MSCTEIYGVKSNGEVVFVDETNNAFRGAMHVWTELSKKYDFQNVLICGFEMLWEVADKGILASFENIVLKSTFDNVMVKKEDIPMLLDAFKEYDQLFPNSSLLEQAEIIEKQILNNEEMIAVCWNQTAINSNPWTDGYDEKIPYNILIGKRHWFLAA